jgi:hypothetical protein
MSQTHSATTSPDAAQRTPLQQVVQLFFAGLLASMVAALVRGSWIIEEPRDQNCAEWARISRPYCATPVNFLADRRTCRN